MRFTGRWWDTSSGYDSKAHLGFPAAFNFRDWLIFCKRSNVRIIEGNDREAPVEFEGARESRVLQDWKESCVPGLNEISCWTCACLFCLLFCLCAMKDRREAASWLWHACFSTWMLMLPLVVMRPLKHTVNAFQNTRPAWVEGGAAPVGTGAQMKPAHTNLTRKRARAKSH